MKPEESKPPVRVERRGAALWIWIDREERRNAINKGVIAGIAAAVRAAQDDPALRAVVLTGAGRKAFCAGADLTDGAQTFTLGLDEPTTDFGRLARLTRDLGIPLVGRVNGDCVAGGMGLMALCDLVVVADHARFGLPEAKVGVFPMQVLVFLRAMIGARHVNELCLTGELIDAARARHVFRNGTAEAPARQPVYLRRVARQRRVRFGERLHQGERDAVSGVDGERAAQAVNAGVNHRRAPLGEQRHRHAAGIGRVPVGRPERELLLRVVDPDDVSRQQLVPIRPSRRGRAVTRRSSSSETTVAGMSWSTIPAPRSNERTRDSNAGVRPAPVPLI